MKITHLFGEESYVKEIRLNPGDVIGKHVHDFDHISVLLIGSAYIKIGDITRFAKAPCAIKVQAGVDHEVTAITEAVWLCAHATDCKDPDEIDNVLTRKTA